jgi:hypothetical protein
LISYNYSGIWIYAEELVEAVEQEPKKISKEIWFNRKIKRLNNLNLLELVGDDK